MEVGAPDHEGYLRAITSELDRRAEAFSGELVSIYFGGGTPSLWQADCLARVVERVQQRFGGRAREITIEANPTDCNDANLVGWRAAGINRVSIGVQSLAADELVVLGRDHRFGDGPAALGRVLAAGLAASCDFILGTPTTRAYDHAWIDPIAATSIGHLSVYELTIEERTVFGKSVASGRLIPRVEDTLADLYIATHDALTARGFEHYEISSYARAGARAVHNSLYWRGMPFLGLGVGAASLELSPDGSGARATNPRRVRDYLAGVAPSVVLSTPDEMRVDRTWLAMRTRDGVPEDDLPPALVDWLVSEGLADKVSGAPGRHVSICPTLRGFLMSDRIAARIAEAL